jgi:hypothetical protein
MTLPEILIVALAVLQFLALLGMGIAGFLLYRRAKTVVGWTQPSLQESRAIAARGKATALETRQRVQSVAGVSRALVQHVGRKAQTTTRLAREVVHPDLTPLQEASRALTGARGLVSRLSRLREAGRIAAGQGDGKGTPS